MAPIRFVLFASDGRVVVLIKGVRYEYITPAYHHDRWKRRARRAPGKVLAEVKKVASEVINLKVLNDLDHARSAGVR